MKRLLYKVLWVLMSGVEYLLLGITVVVVTFLAVFSAFYDFIANKKDAGTGQDAED